MNVTEAIKQRKSQRKYAPRAVEPEKIQTLIDAANNAPKAGVMHITVIENPEILKDINDTTLNAMKNSGNDFLIGRASLDGYQPLYGAPVLMLFSGKTGLPYSEANGSCAAANVTLAAAELGLGSCYVVSPLLGIKAKPELAGKIGLPEDFTPACGALIGYADGSAFESVRAPNTVNFCK